MEMLAITMGMAVSTAILYIEAYNITLPFLPEMHTWMTFFEAYPKWHHPIDLIITPPPTKTFPGYAAYSAFQAAMETTIPPTLPAETISAPVEMVPTSVSEAMLRRFQRSIISWMSSLETWMSVLKTEASLMFASVQSSAMKLASSSFSDVEPKDILTLVMVLCILACVLGALYNTWGALREAIGGGAADADANASGSTSSPSSGAGTSSRWTQTDSDDSADTIRALNDTIARYAMANEKKAEEIKSLKEQLKKLKKAAEDSDNTTTEDANKKIRDLEADIARLETALQKARDGLWDRTDELADRNAVLERLTLGVEGVLAENGWEEFNRTFPHGYERIKTRGDGLLCGLFAIINTMMAMHPSLPLPNIDDLSAISQSSSLRAFTFGTDVVNTSNFGVDQVAAVLEAWGNSRGLVLRLGCLIKDKRPFVQRHSSDAVGPTTVWIYNNGNNLDNEAAMGHYEGMKPLEKVETPDVALVRMIKREMDAARAEMADLKAINAERNVQIRRLEDEAWYPKSSFSEETLANLVAMGISFADFQKQMGIIDGEINDANIAIAIDEILDRRSANDGSDHAQGAGKKSPAPAPVPASSPASASSPPPPPPRSPAPASTPSPPQPPTSPPPPPPNPPPPAPTKKGEDNPPPPRGGVADANGKEPGDAAGHPNDGKDPHDNAAGPSNPSKPPHSNAENSGADSDDDEKKPTTPKPNDNPSESGQKIKKPRRRKPRPRNKAGEGPAPAQGREDAEGGVKPEEKAKAPGGSPSQGPSSPPPAPPAPPAAPAQPPHPPQSSSPSSPPHPPSSPPPHPYPFPPTQSSPPPPHPQSHPAKTDADDSYASNYNNAKPDASKSGSVEGLDGGKGEKGDETPTPRKKKTRRGTKGAKSNKNKKGKVGEGEGGALP